MSSPTRLNGCRQPDAAPQDMPALLPSAPCVAADVDASRERLAALIYLSLLCASAIQQLLFRQVRRDTWELLFRQPVSARSYRVQFRPSLTRLQNA